MSVSERAVMGLRKAGRLASGGARLAVRTARERPGWTAMTVMAVVVAVGALIWTFSDPAPELPARVERGALPLSVEVEGDLAAVRAVHLGPPPVQLRGEFKIAFLAPEGSAVKAGQPVIGFDTQSLALSFEQQQAELAEVTKKVEQKEIDVRVRQLALEQQLAQAEARLRKARLKADVPLDVVARIEARKAELDVRSAEAEVASLEAEIEALKATGEAEARTLRNHAQRAASRLASLQKDMASMTVVAPQDGIVIYKTSWNDEKPKVGDSVWGLEKVVTLPDLSQMKASGVVDEADGGRVRVGQVATLRLEARPDLDLRGRVTSIARTVQRKSRRVPIKVYRVEIALEHTDPTIMRPDMRFRGTIEVARVANALLIPRDTVFLRPAGPVVFVKGPWGFTERSVKLGRHNEQRVEVLEGVREGDRLSPVDLRVPTKAPPRRAAGEVL